MDPSYLDDKQSDDAALMLQVLHAALLVVANSSGGVSPEEVGVFERFCSSNRCASSKCW
jgi:tellurite resistance protein